MRRGAWGRIAKAVGRTRITLSMAVTIGIVLGLFVVQEAGAATDVYLIQPVRPESSATAASAKQTFIATCDTIDSVTFFIGAKQTGKTYTATIEDSAQGWTTIWTSPACSTQYWEYKDIGFGAHIGVTRGKTYAGKLTISSGTWNYFYDGGNPFAWGRMYIGTYGPTGANRDLAARVLGTNHIAPDFWGANWEIAFSASYGGRDTYALQADSIGAKWNREWFHWWLMEKDSLRSIGWGPTDSAVFFTQQKSDSMVGVLFGTPKWASPDTETGGGWPPRYMSSAPRNLDSAVVVGGNINPANYWGYFVYRVVNRYKDTVKYWEVWNEENGWSYWRIFLGDPTDSVARANRFKRLWIVADSAAKKADPSGNTKLVLGGISNVIDPQSGTTGYWWLKKMYELDVADSSRVISFHYYHNNTTVTLGNHFNKSVDSLRSLMRINGDAAKPAWLTEIGWTTLGPDPTWVVNKAGQANRLVYGFALSLARLGDAKGAVNKVQWYNLKDSNPGDTTVGGSHGLDSVVTTHKYSWYAFKQMTGKLKDKYFNRRVPLADTSVYCYEFQDPGATCKKTWVVWRGDDQTKSETLAVRTTTADWIKIQYSVAESIFPKVPLPDGSGKVEVVLDSVPHYLKETGTMSRPDVIVDSVWTEPTSPKAGDSVWFYARIKNISTTDSLKSTIVNKVTFQVDGLTKATYQAQRGLTRQGDTLHLDTLTVGNSNPQAPPPKDWQTNYGDHLVRAWADSADRYVELREDNNFKYLWKHFQPKVSVVINNDHKYSNHLTNDTLHIVMNGGTSPTPDSAKLKHEGGSWTRSASSRTPRSSTACRRR